MKLLGLTTGILTLLSISAAATTRYVDVNGTNATPPYTNWATAATTIQDAVDAASAGDEIVVTNGVYATGGRAVYGKMTNRVAVTKQLTILSVNGPEFTAIAGRQTATTNGDGAIRCVYLSSSAVLIGFTLTNGATRGPNGDSDRECSGGGAWCPTRSGILANCLLVKNHSSVSGGGVYGGTLSNCSLIGNKVTLGFGGGGGACKSTLYDSFLSANSIGDGLSGDGGGAFECTLHNCSLISNSAGGPGGGAYRSILNNCTVSGNSGLFGGGTYWSTLTNCLIVGNSAQSAAGGVDLYQGFAINCTIISNSALNSAGGVGGSSNVSNCIIYYNNARSSSNYGQTLTLNHCCTFPMPTNTAGNITNAPLFMDQAAGNYSLQSNSPCINAGAEACDLSGFDLGDNPRIVGGTVDIGAYEFQTPSSVLSYAWAQQYGLPTDGSADFTDGDNDSQNNWQEWKAHTIPTNSESVLRMTSISNGVIGPVLQWQSTNSRTYFLERSTDLSSQPPFSNLASNIAGQALTTTYTDTTGTNGGPFFYRVGVQE
jgi:hypothetical protein